jgi:hypothetical protein
MTTKKKQLNKQHVTPISKQRYNKNGEENEWYEQKFQGGRSYIAKIYCTNSCASLTASARPSHSAQ